LTYSILKIVNYALGKKENHNFSMLTIYYDL